MKKFTFTLLITLIISANVLALEGSGTETDPWRIKSLADFNDFTADANYWDDHTCLETDINLAGINYTTAPITPDTNNSSTSFDGIPFTGIFEGNGFVISNLTINGGSYLGLFGFLAEKDYNIEGSCEIKNLGVIDLHISGTGSCVGGLCGWSHFIGQISNCYSTGLIRGVNNTYTGGVCGFSHGVITNCNSESVVVGSGDNVGGICGYGSISNCYFTGIVATGGNNAGGLCGSGSVSNCYCTGVIIGHDYVGGICGTGSACNSYSAGTVDGNNYVGGLCGSANGDVYNSYSTSTVYGNNYVGGLCGYNYRSNLIFGCYSNGNVSGNDFVGGFCGCDDNSGWDKKVSIRNCFWDTETSGMINGLGNREPSLYELAGKTTDEMQNIDTYTGWIFADLQDGSGTWYMSEKSYPELIAFVDSNNIVQVPDVVEMNEVEAIAAIEDANLTVGDTYYVKSLFVDCNMIAGLSACANGYVSDSTKIDIYISDGIGDANGSPEKPYPVACQPDLDYIKADVNSSNNCYIMTTDIYCNTYSFYGDYIIKDFTGVLDGDEHKIVNLRVREHPCNNVRRLGFFDRILEGGQIKNLGLTKLFMISSCYAGVGGLCGDNLGSIDNCYVTGVINEFGNISAGDGGLCGINSGFISNCYSNVTVNGNCVGGLCGSNGNWQSGNDGSISNSYSTGIVSGIGSTGGICGSNPGDISNSYSNATVNGDYNVGGLCGHNSGYIINCYAKGTVSSGDGSKNVGGLCGYNEDTITNCYSTGVVTSGNGSELTGGLCGRGSNGITNCFWDKETSGMTTSSGGSGQTIEQMQKLSTFTNAGWDFFDEDINNGSGDIWRMCVDGMDYPKLSWQFPKGDFACGDGVDFVDFAALADTWNLTIGEIGYNNKCDLADDDMINFADLAIFINHWLEGVE